uniref:Uncharacterized protein n=1 Tax=viral metagenome TaxID=1070528 RepID=A0A6C0D5Q2_9ZZZZ
MATPSENLIKGVNNLTTGIKTQINRVNPVNYGPDIKNCFPIIAYIIFAIIYVAAFIALYVRNSALVGIVLLYVINIVYSIFIIKDMFLSKKSEQVITIIITSIIILNAVSSTMVVFTLKTLHSKFNKEKETMKLSNESKKIISIYFTMFITTIAFTWFLALFYFGESHNTIFFDYIFIGKIIPPRMLMIIFILKICLCGAGLGLSGYMVFLSDRFSKLKNSKYVQ